MFTLEDVNAYKAVMARYAAKNNRLIEKWTKFRDSQVADLGKVSLEKPSPARDAYQLVLERARDVAELILSDLRLPADAEISDFDWRDCI